MDLSTRSSFESTLHESHVPFLNGFEKLDEYTNYRPARRLRLDWAVIIPWALCLLLLAAMLILQARANGLIGGPPFGYWTARELEIAKREIPATLKQIRFTGGLRYNESKQLYREIEPGIPDYSGIPTPEVDAAWHELISTTDVFLTEGEVRENIENGGTFSNFPRPDDSLYTDPFTGLYQAVPTVFHDLHCLDKIRRAIYIDYYPQDLGGVFWPHLEHCIDTIRQSIMCASDMTPIPEAYTDLKPTGTLEPIFQVEHTCRDFSAIQTWAKGRDALDDAVWKKNAERLKPSVLAK